MVGNHNSNLCCRCDAQMAGTAQPIIDVAHLDPVGGMVVAILAFVPLAAPIVEFVALRAMFAEFPYSIAFL